jgi:hypothetical protein
MKHATLARTLAVVALIFALALPAAAKDDALSLVPANAVTVGMVKLSEMRSSPLSSMLFQHTDRMSSDGEAEKFLNEAGLSPSRDVDVLVVATTPRTSLGSEADVLVIAEGRFDVPRLSAALLARGATQKSGYIIFPEANSSGESGAVAFLTPSLAIGGNERSVTAALAARSGGGTGFTARGSLAMDLGRIDPAATAWAIIDVPRSARLGNAGSVNTGGGNSGEALQAALRTLSTVAFWATDTGDSLKIGAFGLSADRETLELLEDTIRGALSALRLAARDKAPEMVSVLRRFDVSRKNNAVTVEGSIPGKTLREITAKQRAAAAQ